MVFDVFVVGVFTVNCADVTFVTVCVVLVVDVLTVDCADVPFVTVCVVLVVVAQLDDSSQKPSMWSQNFAQKV